MEGKVYAEGVVKAALGIRPTRSLWRGHQAWNVWLLVTLMPRMFWDYYFTKVFNLTKLATIFKSSKKSL